MTAEETLEKHLTPMLKREPRSYQLISEMKETLEWEVTIQAMEAYKEAELQEAREGFLRFARQADLDYPDDIVMKNYRDWLNKQDKEDK